MRRLHATWQLMVQRLGGRDCGSCGDNHTADSLMDVGYLGKLYHLWPLNETAPRRASMEPFKLLFVRPILRECYPATWVSIKPRGGGSICSDPLKFPKRDISGSYDPQLLPTGRCTFPPQERLETRIGDNASIECAERLTDEKRVCKGPV